MFGKSQIEAIERNYGINMNGYKNWFDTTMVMDKISKEKEKTIQQAISDGKFDNDYISYAEKLNSELEKVFSYLVVYDNEKYTYIGIPNEISSEILIELPAISGKNELWGKAFLLGETEKFLVYPNYLEHRDGTHGYLSAGRNKSYAAGGKRVSYGISIYKYYHYCAYADLSCDLGK